MLVEKTEASEPEMLEVVVSVPTAEEIREADVFAKEYLKINGEGELHSLRKVDIGGKYAIFAYYDLHDMIDELLFNDIDEAVASLNLI